MDMWGAGKVCGEEGARGRVYHAEKCQGEVVESRLNVEVRWCVDGGEHT
jgi:hypothetical protein